MGKLQEFKTVLESLWNYRNNDGVWVSHTIVGEAKMGGLGKSLFPLQFYTSNVTHHHL